jgi:1-acyl-sn-glycerol-3-phosphate acyltransferase
MILYQIARNLTRLSLHLYTQRMGWEGQENIPKDKPVLFCCTHSNSFLDALYLCCFAGKPVYPLARGDAFKRPAIANILYEFKMLPIFRQQEGEPKAAEKNEVSFAACQILFEQNKYVLIFPEGVCKHQTTLLPMKLGAPMMAIKAWQSGLDLHIVPVGIHYDSFTKWGKKCDITIGKPICKDDFNNIATDKKFLIAFNEKLFNSMTPLFPSPYNYEGNKVHFGFLGQLLYYIGWLLHFPLYFLIQYWAKKITKNTVFYDSAVVGFLVIGLPIYYLILILIYNIIF